MASQVGDPRTVKVLMISDDEKVLKFVRDALSGGGKHEFLLDQTGHGEEARRLVGLGQHGAVIFDMPEHGAVQNDFRRTIDRRRARTPVIVLASPAQAASRADFQEAGAADVLLKSDLVAPLIRRAIEYAVDFAEIEDRVADLALFDEMTGLPSMTLFWEFLSYAVKRAQRQDERLAVMGIYVNGLGDINESRGHDFGDRVLLQVANNIQSALRSCDAVARLGGTKFVALLEPLGEDENVHIVSERVAAAVAVPIEVGGVSVNLSATIGVTLYPTSVASPSALLRNATTAMDYAMDRGVGSIHIV